MTLTLLIQFVALAVFAAAVLIGLLRFVRGPGTPDRLVAADMLTVITTAVLVFLAPLLHSALYLDVALIYGVLAFIGIVALARIIETGRRA